MVFVLWAARLTAAVPLTPGTGTKVPRNSLVKSTKATPYLHLLSCSWGPHLLSPFRANAELKIIIWHLCWPSCLFALEDLAICPEFIDLGHVLSWLPCAGGHLCMFQNQPHSGRFALKIVNTPKSTPFEIMHKDERIGEINKIVHQQDEQTH